MMSMRKFTLGFMAIAFLGFISGCTAFLAGAGAVGIGMDTVRLERYTDYNTAWNAAIESLHDLSASIELEDETNNEIRASMSGYKIKILVQKSLKESILVDVSVRKKGLPNLKLADKILEQINIKLRQKK
ncbi:MAG: hypothetical protein V1739_02845 [Candidatus Omnitrophota bacterium]